MSLEGFKSVGPLMLEQMVTEEAEAQEGRRRDQQAKAAAYAHVTHAFGTTVRNMTPAQRAMADAVARRWSGQGDTTGRVPGFRLDPRGRRPTR